MDDKQAMHAMSIDDAYHVERTLARGPSGVTELVSIDGNGPFVRKKIPSPLAQRNVWRRSAPARVIVCRVWKRRTSCPDRVRHRLRLRAGQHACAKLRRKTGGLHRMWPCSLSTKFAKPCRSFTSTALSTATSRRPTSSWPRMARISSISASRASGQRQATVHGIPRRLAPTDSPRLSNMALPKPTRVPTYSRWAGYSDSC